MFVDVAKIKIKAGDGGDGAVSFHREKYIASGGPDGGDGGKGGNIVFVADSNLSTLADFRYKRKYLAQKGENGKAARRNGKNAPDLIIHVPIGTLVKDAETGRLMADVSTKEPVVVARGGKGGWGNTHFATPTRQTPRFAKPGLPGEEFDVQLELKLLADVGLVGFPNVGKSTLVSVVSQAKPVIANYHFTTITPVLGVVSMGEGSSFVMADIPGLIEGAWEGTGLGHQFLRHVERCRLLVHIVDISGSEGRDPIEDFEIINRELEKFNPELAKRPMLVAGNKCDLATDEQIENFKNYVEEKGYMFFPIMAAIRYDVDPLLNKIQEMLSKLPPIAVYEAEPVPVVAAENVGRHDVKITVHDGIYFVEGKWLLNVIKSVNFDDYESLNYFQKVLINSGVIDALREAGINEGDTVSIYDLEFDFVE
ncbi:MAG TPA: GTPase ObgE [Candidatus Limousia pullorum]|uniref:GTPase Obg n=1 Tax=Candidatus Limousia pullorum TaxID=2840860 RepID=A0A9D1LZA2_9FIRM|nr:GTPase ObgE [Anaeromassilibacillus sp. An172]MEE0762725.1 GTPase ObgE [Acutalibacteraceae bacterium]OUP80182.1 GTPase CgtA [Anaeromassilibacillus sp. An172]HIU50761.1 GTPase ObgE [Candidatus Limousia pullorum]